MLKIHLRSFSLTAISQISLTLLKVVLFIQMVQRSHLKM